VLPVLVLLCLLGLHQRALSSEQGESGLQQQHAAPLAVHMPVVTSGGGPMLFDVWLKRCGRHHSFGCRGPLSYVIVCCSRCGCLLFRYAAFAQHLMLR
jgi:hypothetical protein